MIRGVHTMFYTSEPEALRAFLRDMLGFPATDVGGGWLVLVRRIHVLDRVSKLVARPSSREVHPPRQSVGGVV